MTHSLRLQLNGDYNRTTNKALNLLCDSHILIIFPVNHELQEERDYTIISRALALGYYVWHNNDH